jgi:citrate lyase gamma subunit
MGCASSLVLASSVGAQIATIPLPPTAADSSVVRVVGNAILEKLQGDLARRRADTVTPAVVDLGGADCVMNQSYRVALRRAGRISLIVPVAGP